MEGEGPEGMATVKGKGGCGNHRRGGTRGHGNHGRRGRQYLCICLIQNQSNVENTFTISISITHIKMKEHHSHIQI